MKSGPSGILVLILIFSTLKLSSQKVGVVLSGGGASALAHVGVLKALEENNIPIDYITGTSMGAMIGAMYACGFTPDEIEQFITSESFHKQAMGNVEDKHIYVFKKREENASWITIKLALDSTLETTLPTNLVDPIPIDFTLMEYTSTASAAANYNFDSLMVPFRCIASDIESKKSVLFKSGDLGESVRASMSYPFYLKPIMVDGKLLFDGGIYNNFPSNVMYDEFFPDIIIGSNVSNNEAPPTEDNLISQLKTMLLSKTNFDALCQNGVIIEPNIKNIGTFNFDMIKESIDSGYVATLRKLADIRKYVHREVTKAEINAKRNTFLKKKVPLVFDKITVKGLNKWQSKYVSLHLLRNRKTITVNKLKPNYYKLAADEKIKQLYPKAVYNKTNGMYELNLHVKKEKDIHAQVGGNFSNRPINMGFLAVQYNYLGRIGVSLTGNIYAGKLYGSAQGKARLDFPFVVPFYIEPSITYNRWDFFKSSTSFFETSRPPYLVQYESFGDVTLGLPAGNRAKLLATWGYAYNTDEYYLTDLFTETDTADKTDFELYTLGATYELNTLNRKQYANRGTFFRTQLRYVEGTEYYVPGTTAIVKDSITRLHQWLVYKLSFEHYFNTKTFYIPGITVEGVYSGQSLFSNYISSVLAAPVYQPTPETKTLFLERFRAHKYLAVGFKNIFVFKKIFEIRLEGYFYQPFQQIIENDSLQPDYAAPFTRQYYIASASFMIHTPIGPINLSGNYYHNEKDPFTLLFHFGYIIFNRKTMD